MRLAHVLEKVTDGWSTTSKKIGSSARDARASWVIASTKFCSPASEGQSPLMKARVDKIRLAHLLEKVKSSWSMTTKEICLPARDAKAS